MTLVAFFLEVGFLVFDQLALLVEPPVALVAFKGLPFFVPPLMDKVAALVAEFGPALLAHEGLLSGVGSLMDDELRFVVVLDAADGARVAFDSVIYGFVPYKVLLRCQTFPACVAVILSLFLHNSQTAGFRLRFSLDSVLGSYWAIQVLVFLLLLLCRVQGIAPWLPFRGAFPLWRVFNLFFLLLLFTEVLFFCRRTI